MRRNRIVVLSLTMVLLAASAALATEQKKLEATGQIKSIDLKQRTVQIDTGYGTDTFKVGYAAVVEQQDPSTTLTLSKLKVGERVKVHYTMEGADRMASKIDVLPSTQASNSSMSKTANKPRYHRRSDKAK